MFDRHRVGSFEYDWSLEREDGRRCLEVEEMEARGWRRNEQGRWVDPAEVARGMAALARSRR
jgi:hypothetical protein